MKCLSAVATARHRRDYKLWRVLLSAALYCRNQSQVLPAKQTEAFPTMTTFQNKRLAKGAALIGWCSVLAVWPDYCVKPFTVTCLHFVCSVILNSPVSDPECTMESWRFNQKRCDKARLKEPDGLLTSPLRRYVTHSQIDVVGSPLPRLTRGLSDHQTGFSGNDGGMRRRHQRRRDVRERFICPFSTSPANESKAEASVLSATVFWQLLRIHSFISRVALKSAASVCLMFMCRLLCEQISHSSVTQRNSSLPFGRRNSPSFFPDWEVFGLEFQWQNFLISATDYHHHQWICCNLFSQWIDSPRARVKLYNFLLRSD